MKMARNLRHFMAERHLTVASLAEQAKMPKKTLYHWLNGQSPRNLDQLLDICDILGVSVETLLGRASRATPPPSPLFTADTLEKELRAGTFEVILRPITRSKK